MLQGRIIGRLPDREWYAFHPSYKVKRWALGVCIAAAILAPLLVKVMR